MIKRLFSLIVMQFVICSAIIAQTSIVDSSSVERIRIDPLGARGAKASEVFEEVNYIPLETTKESLFGRITRLKVVEGNFLVYDNDTKSILIFNDNGKYVNKIEGSKIKDNGNVNLFTFEIQEDGNQKIIVIKGDKYVLCYGLDGKLIRKDLSENDELSKTVLIRNSSYTYQKNWYDTDSTKYGIAFFKEDKIYSKYFPSQPKKQIGEYHLNVIGGNQEEMDKNYFITRNYDYNIYQAKPPQIKLAYQFVFLANSSLPLDFRDNPIYKGEANRKAFFDKNKDVIYGLGNVHLFGRNLFFKIGKKFSSPVTRKTFVYKLNTRDLISLENIEPDERSYYLPVNDSGKGVEFTFFGFLSYDEAHLYTSCSSLTMFGFKETAIKKDIVYNSALTEYFKTQNKNSNPVIIQLRPKLN